MFCSYFDQIGRVVFELPRLKNRSYKPLFWTQRKSRGYSLNQILTMTTIVLSLFCSLCRTVPYHETSFGLVNWIESNTLRDIYID